MMCWNRKSTETLKCLVMKKGKKCFSDFSSAHAEDRLSLARAFPNLRTPARALRHKTVIMSYQLKH